MILTITIIKLIISLLTILCFIQILVIRNGGSLFFTYFKIYRKKRGGIWSKYSKVKLTTISIGGWERYCNESEYEEDFRFYKAMEGKQLKFENYIKR